MPEPQSRRAGNEWRPSESEHPSDLRTRANHGRALLPLCPNHIVQPRQLDGQNLAVEERQGRQCLIPRCRCDVAVDCRMCEKCLHLGSTPTPQTTLVVQANIPPGPVDIPGLRSYAVVPEADAIPKLVEDPVSGRCMFRLVRSVHVLHPNEIIFLQLAGKFMHLHPLDYEPKAVLTRRWGAL